MKTQNQTQVIINGQAVALEGERNLLEVVRKAKIELPTFCYHSELSIYGACRLCLVDVEGRGILPACSTPPEPGMKVTTHTPAIREIRKLIVELLLANHENNCPTCSKSAKCQLQSLARKLGITQVRFKPVRKDSAVDDSSPSLVRDPDKCVLCGDCVRLCSEIQGIGAIDFAFRGSQIVVQPAFGKDLGSVECVNCGQCARVCPTGALTPKSSVAEVWAALHDPKKTVVAQVAPAVRVAIGELFGYDAGVNTTGLMISALRRLGFNRVYDTAFTADLTIWEEGNEFLKRFQASERLPQFTSCCPGWVKFMEQYYPEMLPLLSSCKSPQQMFGSLAKSELPKTLQVAPENLVVVSIMPCTAKKYEAQREEFRGEHGQDVDYVLTTQELARMIEEAGLRYKHLEPESFDLPFGFKTGAGVIFGNSGGVTEAVLRFVAGATNAQPLEFPQTRGTEGIRKTTVDLNGREVSIAMVHGLKNARQIVEEIRTGQAHYDFVEVMACPGGCIGGAGQPFHFSRGSRTLRRKGLYEDDRSLPMRHSQDNPYIKELYTSQLEHTGSPAAHSLLHTHYHSRRRMEQNAFSILKAKAPEVVVSVCVGTSCYLRGAQELLHQLLRRVQEQGLTGRVEVKASFCYEQCAQGPTVLVNDELLSACSVETAWQAILSRIQGVPQEA